MKQIPVMFYLTAATKTMICGLNGGKGLTSQSFKLKTLFTDSGVTNHPLYKFLH